MPVRIYDISKKLHLESKQVLAKAKALGLTAARVASSSLDKITAEYLELEIIKEHPELAAPAVPAEQPVVTLVTPPPAEVRPSQEREVIVGAAPAAVESAAAAAETTS